VPPPTKRTRHTTPANIARFFGSKPSADTEAPAASNAEEAADAAGGHACVPPDDKLASPTSDGPAPDGLTGGLVTPRADDLSEGLKRVSWHHALPSFPHEIQHLWKKVQDLPGQCSRSSLQ
jgi:hypothetical protein